MEIETTCDIAFNHNYYKERNNNKHPADCSKKWVSVESLIKILKDDSILDLEEYLNEELIR